MVAAEIHIRECAGLPEVVAINGTQAQILGLMAVLVDAMSAQMEIKPAQLCQELVAALAFADYMYKAAGASPCPTDDGEGV